VFNESINKFFIIHIFPDHPTLLYNQICIPHPSYFKQLCVVSQYTSVEITKLPRKKNNCLLQKLHVY